MTKGTAADRAALTADGLPAGLVGGSLVYAGMVPMRLLLFPGPVGVRMSVVTGGVAILFALVRAAMLLPAVKVWVGRRSWLLFVICAIEPLNALLLGDAAWLTVGPVLMVVVTGALLHVRAHAVGVIGGVLAVWTLIATDHDFTPDWRSAGASLGAAVVVAAILNWVRVGTADRIAETQAVLRSIATTDGLTGLHNRRGFVEAGHRHLDVARGSGLSVALLYLDIDALKRLNDTQGHAAGDALLRATAQALTSAVRDSDVAARLGGDEFCLLVTGAAAEHADLLEARIARVLAGAGVSASLGVARAVAPLQPGILEELLARADRAMYAAKLARPVPTPPADPRGTATVPDVPRVECRRAAAGVGDVSAQPPPLETLRELGVMTAVAAAALTVLAAVQPLLHTGRAAATMTVLLGGTAALFALLRGGLAIPNVRPFLEARTKAVIAVMLLVVSANAVIAVQVLSDPEATTAVIVAVLAAAGLISSRRLAVLVVGLTVAGWVVVALPHRLAGTWDDMAVNLGATLIVAVVLHVTQATSVRRLITAEAQIRAVALTDGLTGLLNRDGFLLAGRHVGRPGSGPCAVLFVDTDGLKHVNDTMGHDAGDRLIVATGETLRRTARADDLVARLGGDEFAMLLAGADATSTRVLVSRLRARLADSGISASVGVARSTGGESLEELLDRADDEMYRQKRARGGARELLCSAEKRSRGG